MSELVLPWELLVELRKEIGELQKQRQQVLALKVTAIGAAMFLILSNRDSMSLGLLALPALAAAFFDIDASGISVSIKEIGIYIRHVLESQLVNHESWDRERPLWERHINSEESAKYLNLIGSSGLTVVSGVVGIVGLGWMPACQLPSQPRPYL